MCETHGWSGPRLRLTGSCLTPALTSSEGRAVKLCRVLQPPPSPKRHLPASLPAPALTLITLSLPSLCPCAETSAAADEPQQQQVVMVKQEPVAGDAPQPHCDSWSPCPQHHQQNPYHHHHQQQQGVSEAAAAAAAQHVAAAFQQQLLQPQLQPTQTIKEEEPEQLQPPQQQFGEYPHAHLYPSPQQQQQQQQQQGEGQDEGYGDGLDEEEDDAATAATAAAAGGGGDGFRLQTRAQAAAAAAAAAAAGLAAGAGGLSGLGTTGHLRTRAECLERYRQKKARRHYSKKIRWGVRGRGLGWVQGLGLSPGATLGWANSEVGS